MTAGNSLSPVKKMWEGFIVSNRQDPEKNLPMLYYRPPIKMNFHDKNLELNIEQKEHKGCA